MSDQDFPADIYTEPSQIDVQTLRNLGPLTHMAGIWEGTRGLDVKPKSDGPRKQVYVERMELHPIDPVTNGPQLLYGLRYHTHITKPDQAKTYHEQVGYWLWEPATGTVTHTLAIPRAQMVMAVGQTSADADQFELIAQTDSPHYGILASPFLHHAFRTVEFRIKVTVKDPDNWIYDEDTVLDIKGQAELFHHTDRNFLTRIGAAIPNPLAR